MPPTEQAVESVRSVAEIEHELDSLVSAGFLVGWSREGRYWFIQSMGLRWCYLNRQIIAWLDGAHSMGAW